MRALCIPGTALEQPGRPAAPLAFKIEEALPGCLSSDSTSWCFRDFFFVGHDLGAKSWGNELLQLYSHCCPSRDFTAGSSRCSVSLSGGCPGFPQSLGVWRGSFLGVNLLLLTDSLSPQDNYTFAQPGIQKKVKALEELVSRIDGRWRGDVGRVGALV